jgi:hypothetical protein
MAERVLGPTGSRRRRRFLFVPILLIAAAALLFVGAAQAVHDETFQLDGDVLASTTTNNGGHAQSFDWNSFFNSSGNPIQASFPDASVPGYTASGFDRDFALNANGSYNSSDVTTYTQGSKDIDNISNWVCTAANNVTNKGDIQNSYAVAYTDPVSGHQFLYFGLERNFNQGDANVAFWFLQDGTANCSAANGTTNFTGNHADGDLFVVSAFTKGGVVSTINAYRWNGGANGSLGTTPVASGGDCTATQPPAPLGDPACATSNKQTISTPWLTNNNGKDNGTGHSLLTSEFFEGGVDLTQSGLSDKCFNTFVADTRSSQSFTATLYDFARGTLGECKSTTTTTPTPSAGSSTEIPANAQVTSSDSAQITVTGVSKFSGTVKFFLCGPGVSANGNCQTGGVQIGSTTTLTDVTSPQTVLSSSVTLTKVGKYCWRSEYSGDSVRGVPPSTDPKDGTSQSECFTITPKTPQLATAAGAGPVDFGQPVTDTATLTGTANRPGTGGLGDGSINPTGGNGPAQGSITFTLFKADCTTPATGTGTNPQTVQVTNPGGDGTYGPVSFTPDAPGTYHWVASYSGDSPNTNATSHNAQCDDTGEDVVVRQIPTEISTHQSAYPNDSATITSSVAGNNLPSGGTVIFRLYQAGGGNSALQNCLAHGTTVGSGGLIYAETKNNVGGQHSVTTSTSNTTVAVDVSGSYYWRVTYATGDTAHSGRQSDCVENTALTFTNDAGPGTLFP